VGIIKGRKDGLMVAINDLISNAVNVLRNLLEAVTLDENITGNTVMDHLLDEDGHERYASGGLFALGKTLSKPFCEARLHILFHRGLDVIRHTYEFDLAR
jgi:hypothetical protein